MKTVQKTRVAIFGRVSSDEQFFERQISDLEKVADKFAYEVVSIITEKISGAKSNDERLGVQQLFKEAREGKFSKVLCSEVSRLGRNTIETLKLINELHQLGISIYLQDLNSETLDKDGQVSFQTELLLNLMSLFASNERRTLIARINSGIKQAQANGTHCGRFSGTEETKEFFLAKYPKVIEGLKKGFSVRECVKLYDTSLGTVAKIRKMILPELNNVA